jgi:hypothetical protein
LEDIQVNRLHAKMGAGRMKRLLFSACLILPTIARAESTPPLLDIFRDTPGIQDDFQILDFGDHEELAFSSNAFLLPRQEFGKYVRTPTDFPEQVEKLKNSIVGTDFRKPAQKTIDFTGWHVFIKGEEIDPIDPRYGGAFRLLRNQIKSNSWRRKDIMVATWKRLPWLQLSHLQYLDKNSKLLRPHIARQTLDGLEVCPNVVARHLVCQVDHGFILLRTPADMQN